MVSFGRVSRFSSSPTSKLWRRVIGGVSAADVADARPLPRLRFFSTAISASSTYMALSLTMPRGADVTSLSPAAPRPASDFMKGALQAPPVDSRRRMPMSPVVADRCSASIAPGGDPEDLDPDRRAAPQTRQAAFELARAGLGVL